MRVYILLQWYYEGDSHLVNYFINAFKTNAAALKACGENPAFISFINYKTNETSPFFIEGYDPVEYGSYGSGIRYEIREVLLDYRDWDVDILN